MPGNRRTARSPIRAASVATPARVPATAYWRPSALWLTISSSRDRRDVRLELVQLDAGQRWVDDRHPVARDAAGVTRDLALHELAAREHELQRRLERERAEREQGRELAHAVAGGADIVAERAGLAQLGELRRVQRHERGLRQLGALQDAVGMAQHAPVGEPQLGRVALDDVEQREPEPRPRVRVGAGPDLARGARARAPLGAEAAPLHALAAEDEHRRRGRDVRLAERGELAVGEHGHLDDLEAVLQRDARRVQLERRAERDRRYELDPPAPARAGVAVADGVDDERRRAGRRPGAVHDGSLQAAEPRGEHAAVQRVVVAGDARERVHAWRRVVVRLGERHARARQARRRRAGQPRHGGAERMLLASVRRGACQSISTGASPSRRSVPSARHVAAPERGSSVVQRTFSASRSPGAGRTPPSHGCSASQLASAADAGVSSTSWASLRWRRRSVTAAAPRIANVASTRASAPRSLRNSALQVIRVAAPPGSSSVSMRACACPRSPARGGHAAAVSTACPAWTSCPSRAASGALDSSPASAGQASASARSTGVPSCAAPVAARCAAASAAEQLQSVRT